MPSKQKNKKGQEKWKKWEGSTWEKAESKNQDCCKCVTIKPKTYLKIWLSVHAQTPQANILHLDQKATLVNDL